MARPTAGYPGQFAPASLKPAEGVRRIKDLWEGYPGQFAPASLKLFWSCASTTRRSRYPGQFAPASLKHRRRGERSGTDRGLSGAIRPGLIEAHSLFLPSRWRRRYPGQFAPASLKLLENCLKGAVLKQLSGAIRPGLIEAETRSATAASSREVIRGNSPRPH